MSNVVSRSRKAITPLAIQCLWALPFYNALGLEFKDNGKLERTQCRAAGKATGLEEMLKEQCLFILVKRISRGIYWKPVTTWSDKDDGIKLFTDYIEGTMAQNCHLKGSNWSLGKYSSLGEQCRTGRGYRRGSFYSKSLAWPSASDCLIPSSSLSRSLFYATFPRLIFSQCLSKTALYR